MCMLGTSTGSEVVRKAEWDAPSEVVSASSERLLTTLYGSV